MNHDTSRPNVLVIDDEPQIRRLLQLTLEDADYSVRIAPGGREGLAEFARRTPELVILDLSMPDMSGLEVLRRLRERSMVPILILSVSGEEGGKIAGLDAGADDYLTKPFSEGELLARIRALLRRIKPALATNAFCFGDVEVDFTRRSVTKAGAAVRLTGTEYALLKLFIANRDRALTHRFILRELWGPNADTRTNYLRTYMLRLRQKLGENPDQPQHFQTESGIGYRFISVPEGMTACIQG